MKSKNRENLLDETYHHIATLIEEAEIAGPRYWHSRTPQERIQALELMRQRAYGYDPATTQIQRVFEVVQRRKIEVSTEANVSNT